MANPKSESASLGALPTEVLEMIMREYVQPRFFDVMLRSQFSPPTFAHVSRHLRATYLRLAGIASPPATESELFVDQSRYCEFVFFVFLKRSMPI